MGITNDAATFASMLDFEALPPEVVTTAKRALLDTIGVTLAGALEEGSRIALAYGRAQAALPEATVIGSDLRTSAATAALVNGAFGHALDFDDVNSSMHGHPSVPLVPAVLALSEKLGVSGRQALTAFVAGFEVECKVGRSIGPSGYARGWHLTSILGSLGTAAAAASLLRLDSERTRHALAIAASMASGSRQNFGTMTKPLHAGLAARAGVEAALLAESGFTGDPEIIEAPLGFGALYSPAEDFRPDRWGGLGESWEILDPGISVKKYPCCYQTHRALDAALSATAGVAQAPARLERIEVRVPEGSTMALLYQRPKTGLEGKFSMEYCVAAAVLDGAVRFQTFEDASVRRPEAQALLRKVDVVYEPRNGRDQPSAVTITLDDATTLRAEMLHEHGSPTDPLTWEELTAKYLDCASLVLAPKRVLSTLGMLSSLEEVRDIRELMRGLATASL